MLKLKLGNQLLAFPARRVNGCTQCKVGHRACQSESEQKRALTSPPPLCLVKMEFSTLTPHMGFPSGGRGKEPTCQCRSKRLRVQSPRHEDLEEGMATHSSILGWGIVWTEEPGGLQCMGSQRVGTQLERLSTHPAHTHTHTEALCSCLSSGHNRSDLAYTLHTHTHTHRHTQALCSCLPSPSSMWIHAGCAGPPATAACPF